MQCLRNHRRMVDTASGTGMLTACPACTDVPKVNRVSLGVRTLCCIGVLFLAFGGCYQRYSLSQLQDYSREGMALPAEWKDEPLVILEDSIHVTVTGGKGPNSAVSRRSITYYVNREEPQLLKAVSIIESREIEKNTSIVVDVLFPNGEEWRSTSFDMVSAPYYIGGAYDTDDRLVGVILPAYKRGMVIHAHITRNYVKPHHLGVEFMRESFPTLRKTLALTAPNTMPLNSHFHNIEGLDVDSLHSRNEKTWSVYYSAVRLQKIQRKAPLKNPEQWYAGLHFSIPPAGPRSLSWVELGDYYLTDIAQALNPGPQLTALAARAGTTDFSGAIEQVYGLLQNEIRYYADFENAHSFIPRGVEEVLTNGYGDCKEMSTLMMAALRLKGVRAGLALISTEGYFQCLETVPTLEPFNHMILYCIDEKDVMHFIDPTVKWGTVFNSYYSHIGQNVLVLQEGASRIETITPGEGFRSMITTRSTVKMNSETQQWEIEGTIGLAGLPAFSFTPYFNASNNEEKGVILSHMLGDMFRIDARSCDLRQVSSDSIEIFYTAAFQGNYLTMEAPGFLLDKPSLFGGTGRATTYDLDGPRYFQGYTQVDTWLLPPRFTRLESSRLDGEIAHGAWAIDGNSVSRKTVVRRQVLGSDKEDVFMDYLKQKLKYAKSFIWRK